MKSALMKRPILLRGDSNLQRSAPEIAGKTTDKHIACGAGRLTLRIRVCAVCDAYSIGCFERDSDRAINRVWA